MLRSVNLGLGALLAVFLTAALAQSPDRIPLDTGFRSTMNHYATVDRADGKVYQIYINDLALNAWRDERHLPSGTVFAIESFLAEVDANGDVVLDANRRMIAAASENDIHVAMKSENWADDGRLTTVGLLFGEETEGGTWRMAGFDPRDGSEHTELSMAECHECHVDHRAEDFILSRGLLDRYVRSGMPAYISFSCGEREICFGSPRAD